MGMFDTVRCAYPLPSHQDEEFQTKDLAHLVRGELLGGDLRFVNDWREDLPDAHGDIRIYTGSRNAEGGSDWTEFILRFTHGVVETVSEA